MKIISKKKAALTISTVFCGLFCGLILLVQGMSIAPALALELKTSQVIAKLQAGYEKLNSFEASFAQRLTNSANGKVETRHGTILFKQPRLIRWETITPEAELLLVGENDVWNYVPAEKTAYKYSVDDVLRSKTMLRFLSGQARLDQDFIVEKIENSYANTIVLDLIPKEPEPSMVQAHLWLDAKTYLLQKLLLIDFYGNENELELSEVKMDANPKLSLFEFNPPPGVKIKKYEQDADQQ